jgi:hypothetical protein
MDVTATNVPVGIQQWTVASYFDPGAVSSSPTVWPKVTLNVTAPVPINPSGFAAVQTASGQVKLSWQPVSAAAYYIVRGPGFGTSGEFKMWGAVAASQDAAPVGTVYASNGTQPVMEVTATALTAGYQQWSVASYFDPGAISTSAAAWPTVGLNVTTGPVPINPSGFSAVEMVSGHVTLSWQPVTGAAYYIVRGPGLIGPENDGIKVWSNDNAPVSSDGTATSSTNVSQRIVVTTATVAAGTQEWSVASYFFPGPVSTPAEVRPRVTLNVTIW